MENIKDRFLKIKGTNLFTRITPTHLVDIYIGVDEDGRYAIKYRGIFTPESRIKSVSGIEIKQYQNDDFNTLQFSLVNQNNKGLFFTFCDDIIETTKSIQQEKEVYKTILNRFNSWKKMFSVQKNILSESEIIGLIGELLFLQEFLFNQYGKGESLKSWSGQELSHKDFSYTDKWYEVKAIHSGKNSVLISSLEQLDSYNEGELVVFTLEKMSFHYDGIRINTLAMNILNSLENDIQKDYFLDSLLSRGFSFADDYDDLVYSRISMIRYMVNSSFPKLTRNNVNKEIVKAQYELSLNSLSEHIINI